MSSQSAFVDYTKKAARRAEFFELVRTLEEAGFTSRDVGGQAPPEEEVLRFRAWDNLAFAPRDVIDVEVNEIDEDVRVNLMVSFLGLHGPASPLPAHITERTMVDEEGGQNLRDFLDLFNHRAVSLLVRIWRKYRYFLEFDADGRDPSSSHVFAIGGMPRHCDAVFGPLDPVRLLAFSGMLSIASAPASTVESMVSLYFGGVPVRVEPLVMRHVKIEDDQRMRLGRQSCALGHDTVIGERVADVTGKFRLHVGPLDRATFSGMLPDSPNFPKLLQLVKLACRDSLAYDIALSVSRDEVPPWGLGTSGADAIRLGYNSWAGTPDADQTVILSVADEEPVEWDDAG